MRPLQAPAVILVVDTSARAYGGFVRGKRWQFSKEFTAAELARVDSNEFFSSARELTGYGLACGGESANRCRPSYTGSHYTCVRPRIRMALMMGWWHKGVAAVNAPCMALFCLRQRSV
jgi:hypothetical protein